MSKKCKGCGSELCKDQIDFNFHKIGRCHDCLTIDEIESGLIEKLFKDIK